MTIRRKLNLAVMAVILIFLVSAGFALRAVWEYGRYASGYLQMRAPAQLVSSIHTGIFRHLAASHGAIHPADTPDPTGWIRYAIHDIDTRIRLSQRDEERDLWSNLRRAVAAMGDPDPSSGAILSIDEAVGVAEKNLSALRNLYLRAEHDSIATAREKNLLAQQAIWISCSLALVLFLVYAMMIRDQLVKPIELLKSTADAIGAGRLEQAIPLKGDDELAQLARRLEAMATRLAAHQAALLKAGELSAIGEVCTNVAHGLRNPVAAMRARCRAAGERNVSREQLESIIQDLLRQADRMEERIKKLFEFSRPQELRREWSTFRQVALTAKAHALPALAEGKIRVTIDDRSNEARWYVDRDELAYALAELIENAARHSAANAEVVLRCEVTVSDRSGKRLRIQVIDQGAGMVPSQIEKAFNFFFSTRPDGTGMGLAMVRRTVQQHGGESTLTSELGRGTTVTITLPETAADEPPPVEGVPSPTTPPDASEALSSR